MYRSRGELTKCAASMQRAATGVGAAGTALLAHLHTAQVARIAGDTDRAAAVRCNDSSLRLAHGSQALQQVLAIAPKCKAVKELGLAA